MDGGTPSFIEPKYIEKLLKILPKAEEITLEANPCTITYEKLEIYKKAGVNRISIGLQTTNDSILKEIGRAHSLDEFDKAYNLARDVGFKNINVDLMFGLPSQTIEDLKESVDYLIKLNPEHISCYSLILHGDIFKNLPDDEAERKMYYYTKDTLKKAGYIHYEISNFAKKGFESKHNLAYWNQDEYVGVGAGASSYIDNRRYTNEGNLEKYIERVNNNLEVKNLEEIQNNEDKIREYIILKLRLLEGIEISEISQRFNIDMIQKFDKEIKNLVKKELLVVEADKRIKLTQKGLDFANVVWREFI